MKNKVREVSADLGKNGYPQDDLDMNDVWVKGKYPEGTKKKTKKMMRGTGAATKGKMFYEE